MSSQPKVLAFAFKHSLALHAEAAAFGIVRDNAAVRVVQVGPRL